MHYLLGGVADGVGVVEPAVVRVAFLAVHEGEGLHGLGQLVTVLHLLQCEVAAVPLARALLLARPKGPALHAIPGGGGVEPRGGQRV